MKNLLTIALQGAAEGRSQVFRPSVKLPVASMVGRTKSDV
jgi:hypothetical protein